MISREYSFSLICEEKDFFFFLFLSHRYNYKWKEGDRMHFLYDMFEPKVESEGKRIKRGSISVESELKREIYSKKAMKK